MTFDERAIAKRFFYSGKEQRREAKENYEEKCERKFISAALNKARWCPELESWPAWQIVTRGDGIKSKPVAQKLAHTNQHNFNYNHNKQPGFNPNQYLSNQNNFNPNQYPFNQNGNIQFNNQFKSNNDKQKY